MTKEEAESPDVVSIDVLFVRHCESCANVANEELSDLSDEMSDRTYKKTWDRALNIEPLCTRAGIVQSISSGSKIEALAKHLSKKIQMRSSVLVRAMETCKLSSSNISPELFVGGGSASEPPLILRDPNISERWDTRELENRLASNAKTDPYVGSAGTTTVTLSDMYAKILNKKLSGIGLDFSVGKKDDARIRKGCGGERCAIRYSEDFPFTDPTKGEYILFKQNVLSTYDPEVLNVVFSHGWYISEVVKATNGKKIPEISDADYADLSTALYNTQGVLIRFTVTGGDYVNGVTSELAGLIEQSNDYDIKTDDLPEKIRKMFEKGSKFVDCSYRANYGLKPECMRCSPTSSAAAAAVGSSPTKKKRIVSSLKKKSPSVVRRSVVSPTKKKTVAAPPKRNAKYFQPAATVVTQSKKAAVSPPLPNRRRAAVVSASKKRSVAATRKKRSPPARARK